MRIFRFEGEQLLVRLDPGEELLQTLTALVAEQQLASGALWGIGAVKNTTLGYFDLHSRTYDRREFSGEMELVSLTGNITWVEQAPLIHAHATISGPDYVAYAGHLFAAEIAVTGEIFISTTGARIMRALDRRTGLNLIEG